MQVSGEEQLTNNKLRDIQHPILKSYRTNISEDPTGVFHLALSDRANKCYHDSGQALGCSRSLYLPVSVRDVTPFGSQTVT
jgi:hypothetical protein